MNKFKKFWVENRVLCVLFIIVVICVCLILGVCVKYFFGSSKSSYGDRLNGIEQVEVTEEIKNNFINKVKEDETIVEASLDVKGKIIYITLSFNETVKLEDAKLKAEASVSLFEEKYLNFYDLNYVLKQVASGENSGFVLMGARNVHGSGLIWNNNIDATKSEE